MRTQAGERAVDLGRRIINANTGVHPAQALHGGELLVRLRRAQTNLSIDGRERNDPCALDSAGLGCTCTPLSGDTCIDLSLSMIVSDGELRSSATLAEEACAH